MSDIDNKKKLTKLLTTIFQYDVEDLDFGIYKILNYKRKEIKEFLNKELVEEINVQLRLLGSEEVRELQEDLEEISKKLIDFGIQDYQMNPKYQEKKKQLEDVKVSVELENEIYNRIYTFFSRYYDKGDFIGKRRYGSIERYVIPYNGEETLLHWANNEQYYVKTSKSFRKFSFTILGLKINFRVVEDQDVYENTKTEENKYFVVSRSKVYDRTANELNLYFDYRVLSNEEKSKYRKSDQEQINEDNLLEIRKSLDKENEVREFY